MHLPHPLLPAGALAAVATLVAWAMDRHVSLTSQAMVYLLATVYAAFRLGRPQAVLTAVLGVSALNFFFVPPRYSFEVAEPDYAIALGALLLVSLVVSSLAAQLRRQTEQARRGEQRARQLHALGEALAAATSETDLLQRGTAAVHAAFGQPCCAITAAVGGRPEIVAHRPGGAPPFEFDADAARWSIEHVRAMGPTTTHWPELRAWYAPLAGTDGAFGTIAVSLDGIEPPAREEDRRHLETLARQIGAALQRVRLAAAAREAALAAESESARNALLASISHDLRTPLAVIVGAATTLAEQHDRLPQDQRAALLRTIAEEARQTSAAAENVLQLARLSSGALALRCDWESMEEIVGSVIARLRRRRLEDRLRARVPAGLPLVRSDGVLVAQVIENLVDNALKHSPPDEPVELDVRCTDDRVEVAVLDRGPGIDSGEAAQLFSRFYRGRTEAGRAGVGLGLAICKAVVEAHGGSIHARNRPGGGAAFVFALPLGRDAPAAPEPSR